MKKNKILLITSLFILGICQTIYAQLKTDHVEVTEIISKVPMVLESQKQIENNNKTYDADYQKMLEEFKAKSAKSDFETTKQTIESEIKEFARQEYPNDIEMQNYIYKNQIDRKSVV